MGQALYRHYRPKKFDQVIGQEPITTTLKSAIASGRISHAYLFAGPHGVGKTTVARVLAHEVNDLSYTDESIHLDIIEIDAASNRRIDEVRDIRQKVHIAPTSAKYKVYIIDEVHMLTKEAFNALLKTLEEPPAHCIFILATTEAHKLPPTIISRTQRFNFRPIEVSKAVKELTKIAKKEKIDIDLSALELLAQYSEGSFRDSLSMLDQLSGVGRVITNHDARELLGLPPPDSISKLIELIDRGASSDVLNLLTELKEAGNSPVYIATQLGKKLRSEIISSGASRYRSAAVLLKNLLEVSSAKQPYEILEIALLEVALTNDQPAPNAYTRSSPEEVSLPQVPASKPMMSDAPKHMDHNNNTVSNNLLSLEHWPKVLDEIKKRAASIYTALRLAEPVIEDRTLTLTFQFPLHKNKVEQAQHIKLISDVVQELSGVQIEVKCILSQRPKQKTSRRAVTPTHRTEPASSELATISNIFGGGEMLES